MIAPSPIVSTDTDVAIIGGGLVGMSLALALRGAGLTVTLLEAFTPPASAPAWDERCIALNDGSRQIFEKIGVWSAIFPHVQPLTATHISERGRFGAARFTAEDAGLAALGFNTPIRALGAELLAALSASATNYRCPAQLAQMAIRPDAVALTTADGQSLHARLVVAADGAQSAVRRLLGLAAEVREYQQSAIVSALYVQRDPRGVAYERFLPSGPLAVLPKPRVHGDSQPGYPCSLIWTLPQEQAVEYAALTDAEFMALAQTAFGERLGRFMALGQRLVWPLKCTVNKTPAVPRVVFCGNAAQSLHPVAAQGFNLGLRDVAELADRIAATAAAGGDWGAEAELRQYTDARASDRQHTIDFTDGIVRIFSNQLPVLASFRHLGLLALDLSPGMKASVMRQNLGHRGLRV